MSHAHHHHTPICQDKNPSAAIKRLMRLTSYAAVAVALVLVSAKLYAWWVSESLAMLSSLTDSLFDVVVSTLNMLALRYALKPADDDHRFGHTAIEDIVGLAQFVFISAAMMVIILQSFERLFHPSALTHEAIGIGVSLFSMALTIGLVMLQSVVAKRSGSLIIAADRLHYLGDVLFNIGVIFALFLSLNFGFYWADPAIAIIIALSIIISTRSIGKRAFNNLMGHEMPDAERDKITQIVLAVSGVYGLHQLRTRYMGMKPIIQLHAELDDTLSFAQSHHITDAIEAALLQQWPEAEIIVHGDPTTLK
jgi:ferrous-iron efflux pump FieF